MTAIEQARERWEAAVTRLREASWALDEAPAELEPVQLEALERVFEEAEQETRRCEAAFARCERLAEARAGLVSVTTSAVRVLREPLTYEKNGPHSFFRDAYFGYKEGDPDAQQRLQRHRQEVEVERRAIDSTDGTGGEFVAPLWLMDEWIALARAGRPFANAVRRLALPPNTDSINIPKLLAGSATAPQADGGVVSNIDPTTTSVSVPVKTVAGQVDVSRQLFDRSLPGIDQVLFADLAADYATKLDVQLLNGTGSGANAKGVLQDAHIIAVTYTDPNPGATALYPKIADAIQQIHTNRFMSPTGIVMHPRRWGWFLSSLDAQGRPLVLPGADSVNALALVERVGAENVVGTLQGLPVIVDSSIPTNLGTGNEDAVVISRLDDLVLWEEEAPRTRVFEQVLSGTLQIRCQVFGYFAFTSERYSKASAKVTGTGLVTPTF
jgi:HK97 family phage major capsid protein